MPPKVWRKATAADSDKDSDADDEVPIADLKARAVLRATDFDSDDDDGDGDAGWTSHPARKLLHKAFLAGDIPMDYKRKPNVIYDKYKNTPEFKGMPAL